MWANVRNNVSAKDQVQPSMKASSDKKRDLPVVLVTRPDMFEIARLMTQAEIVIDDGIEFGLANALSLIYQAIPDDQNV